MLREMRDLQGLIAGGHIFNKIIHDTVLVSFRNRTSADEAAEASRKGRLTINCKKTMNNQEQQPFKMRDKYK